MRETDMLVGCPECKGVVLVDATEQAEGCLLCIERKESARLDTASTRSDGSVESALDRDRYMTALTSIAVDAEFSEEGGNCELKRFAGIVRRTAEGALYEDVPYRDALAMISEDAELIEFVTENPELENFARAMFIKALEALNGGHKR